MVSDDLLQRGWHVVALWLRFLNAAFGTASEIAARGFLVRAVRRKLLIFLRTAEALARRLLLAQAATISIDNDPPKKLRCRATSATYGRGGFANEDSARWSVSFRYLSSPPSSWGRRPGSSLAGRRPLDPGFGLRPPQDDSGRAHPSSPARGRWRAEGATEGASARHRADLPRRQASPAASPSGGGRLAPSLAIAERIEALIRVLSDPSRYARRLAKRLKRKAGVITLAAPPTRFTIEVWEALTPGFPPAPSRDSS